VNSGEALESKAHGAQNVLFIAPVFFGYDREIEKTIVSKGYKITRLYDRPFDSAFMKGLSKISNALVCKLVEKSYLAELSKFPDEYFDKVLVITGQTLSERVLNFVRRKNKSARLILYMWDAINMRPWVKKKFVHYDYVFTFDHSCAENYGLLFRPLFTSYQVQSDSINQRYDLSFVGTCHNDRFAIVSMVSQKIGAKTFHRFLYLQARWVFWVYKIINPSFRDAKSRDFSFKGIPKAEVDKIFDSSSVILDIEDPRQKGLTIRIFDALAAKKKVITTNNEIEKYKLFDSNNILVIDRKKCDIDLGFFDTPFSEYTSEISDTFSCSDWVEDVFNTAGQSKFLHDS
jgi:hypothetical protein